MQKPMYQDLPLAEAATGRHYYLMAELRRAAMWAIAGCLVIAPTVWYIGMNLGRDPAGLVVAVSAFLLGALWLCQYLLPRLRVDHTGIHRRILWWWDPWLWESFISGQVRDAAGLYSYQNPARAWWRRDLRLGFLEETDAKAINDLIRRVWMPPAEEPLPDTLELRLNWPDSRIVQLSFEQIVISKQTKQSAYCWNDVVRTTVWRHTHDRRDFRELRLQLSDQELTLRRFENHGQECLTWRGASPEVIAGFMCRHVSPDRLHDYSIHDAPKSFEELNARVDREEAKFAEARAPMKWCLRVAWGLVAAMPFFFPWPNGLFMAGIYLPLTIAMQWMWRENARRFEKQRQEFAAQRRRLLSETDLTDE